MTIEIALTLVLPFLASLTLTAWVRRVALSRGVLDLPNERSSHTVPTPRGGGLAIVAASSLSWVALAVAGKIDTALLLALLGGGLTVAVVGWLDDMRRVPAITRLGVHFAAAIWAVALLGPVTLPWGHHEIGSAGGGVLSVLGIVWALNLFNFMDGIDGIAASEAAFILGASAVLSLCGFGGKSWAPQLMLAAACCGFLWWNWPPARVFMGDVGSGYLGYSIAVFALGSARETQSALAVWLILGGLFFVDSTVTLVRRVARGERAHEAHRSHAYQWLARRWASHKLVTICLLAVDLAWLLPWAAFTYVRPESSSWAVLAALLPLLVILVAAGAGRSEVR